MMMPDPSFGGVDARGVLPRVQLEELSRTGATHLRPIYTAMLDGTVAFLFVTQQSGRFGIGGRGGFVALVGDDTDRALGPKGFHAKSIRRLVRQVQSIAIIASDIEPNAYAASAALARMGFGTLIVETRPEQEAAWFETLKAAAPRTPIVLITPIAGTC